MTQSLNIPTPEHFESLYPDSSRFAEIEKIIEYVKQGNSCQVVGLPGVGQSTILKLLIYNKAVRVKHLGDDQKTFHFVLANFSEVRRRPLVDIIKFLFLHTFYSRKKVTKSHQ
jgi:alpha-D-ribose 1-methylphosphonate 5-triphosphate synthase subunit PhnL